MFEVFDKCLYNYCFASSTSSKCKAEIDSHSITITVDSTCLITHNHDRPVNTCSSEPKDVNKCAKMVDAVSYDNPITGHILVMIEAIPIKSLSKLLFCSMQCHLNGVLIIEIQDSGEKSNIDCSCYLVE